MRKAHESVSLFWIKDEIAARTCVYPQVVAGTGEHSRAILAFPSSRASAPHQKSFGSRRFGVGAVPDLAHYDQYVVAARPGYAHAVNCD